MDNNENEDYNESPVESWRTTPKAAPTKWAKEDYEKFMNQLQYFREKIDRLRHEINPHFEGHTYMDTDECRKEFQEYHRQLQLKLERLDRALDEISWTLGKERECYEC
jgi:uncharacterized coiled-coil DUF342 family protein